jgi:nitrite reductase (NO-forming)
LHFHGRHSPAMDGWEPVPPGGESTLQVVAGPAGVHPYHCHVPPVAEHIGRGLYGLFIVDPAVSRPEAHEIALVAGGYAVDDVANAVVAWNGVAGFFEKFPIKIPVGEPIRLYLANMVESEPVVSFHLHAQTFSVWPAGMGDRPAYHSDVVALTLAERAILEFDLPELGRYMFHPHQHHLAMRGAIGWFAAV